MTKKTTAPEKPPRSAPCSVRIGEERTLRFDAYRARDKLSRSDAIHKLMDAGLAQEGFPPPGWEASPKAQEAPLPANGKLRPQPKDAAPKAPPAKQVEASFGPPPSAPGSRLKKDGKVAKRWGL